jgi:hypothetical protein
MLCQIAADDLELKSSGFSQVLPMTSQSVNAPYVPSLEDTPRDPIRSGSRGPEPRYGLLIDAAVSPPGCPCIWRLLGAGRFV